MLKYLLNFTNIQEDYPDYSDYDIFTSNSLTYLTHSPTTHTILSPIFLTSLSNFTNTHLIHSTFKLINALNCFPTIPHALLIKNLYNYSFKNTIYHYLLKNYSTLYKQIIIKDLYDSAFFSENLYYVCNKYLQHDLLTFLKIKNVRIIKKQVDIMILCNNVQDLEYYIGYVGYSDRSICFVVYELIVHVVNKRVDRVLWDFIKVDGACVKFLKKISVECLDNFIFYFIDFMEERELIEKLYYAKDKCGLLDILSRYVESDSDIKFSYKKLFVKEIVIGQEEIEDKKEEDEKDEEKKSYEECNFDYLFGNKHYKVQTDCVEI